MHFKDSINHSGVEVLLIYAGVRPLPCSLFYSYRLRFLLVGRRKPAGRVGYDLLGELSSLSRPAGKIRVSSCSVPQSIPLGVIVCYHVEELEKSNRKLGAICPLLEVITMASDDSWSCTLYFIAPI